MGPDQLGWLGTVLSLGFYIALSCKRITIAYVVLLISAVVWGLVGIVTGLPSLLVKEILIVVIGLWGLRNWSKS
jgi:hypothetical protein